MKTKDAGKYVGQKNKGSSDVVDKGEFRHEDVWIRRKMVMDGKTWTLKIRLVALAHDKVACVKKNKTVPA